MRSLVGVDTTLHGIARYTMAALFATCSIAACVDQPEGDDAVATSEQPISFSWKPWQSVAQGVAGAGTSIAAIPVGGTLYSLFSAASDGRVSTVKGSPLSPWSGWTPVAAAVAAKNTSVTALPTGNGEAALFIVGTDGGIYPFTGSSQTAWNAWPRVGTRVASQGTTVAAVPSTGGSFTLFMVETGGAIYTSVWNNRTVLDWARVGTGLARAATSVAAVPTGNGMFALFVIGTDSHIYTSTGSPTIPWTNWPIVQPPGTNIVANDSTPRATVMADTSGNFTLFYVGTDGGINPITGNAQTGWTLRPAVGGAARSDTPITALLTADGHVALFVIGTDSNIYTNVGTPSTFWFGWKPVPGVSAGSGTAVTAAGVGTEFYLFVPDTTGGVRATSGHY